MKKIVLSLILSLVFITKGFGSETPRFLSNQNSGCSFKCPAFSSDDSDYHSMITDVNYANGTFKCVIYHAPLAASPLIINGTETSIDAGCSNTPFEVSTAAEEPKQKAVSGIEIESKQFGTTSGFTFSRFLSSVVTLDSVDKDSVKHIKITETVQNNNQASGTRNEQGQTEGQTESKATKIITIIPTLVDAMSEANIDYFSNLFNGMSTVYKHLQNLLFVVVGGFFLASIGGAKLQRYLENKGESTGQNQPYLHKFFIPLLCVGIFYMPISKSVNSNGEITATTTVIQELIRYFTREANNIADVASSIGAKTYVKKVSQNLFAKDRVDTVKKQIENDIKNINTYVLGERIPKIETICKNFLGEHYAVLLSSQNAETLDAKSIESSAFFSNDPSQKSKEMISEATRKVKYNADENQAITPEVCSLISQTKNLYKNKVENLTFLKSNVSEAKNDLSKLGKDINNRERIFGWINAIFVPSTLILFETQSAVSVLKPDPKADMEAIIKSERELKGLDTRTRDFQTNGQVWVGSDFIKSGVNYTAIMNQLSKEIDKIPFLLFPGAYAIYNWFSGLLNDQPILGGITRASICYARQFGLTISKESIAGGMSSCVVETFIPSYFGLNMVHYSYTKVVDYLPIICASVATILAVIGYLVTLCKYFYISPFVVAFSLTTKRLDKIVNFLVTGITIFFKPVLIVLFVYLALFLHTLVYEVFTMSAQGQFASIDIDTLDFSSILFKGVAISLIQFMGSIASCYVMFKTIVTGPDWTFKLLGLDRDTDNVISQGLVQKLEQRAVMV